MSTDNTVLVRINSYRSGNTVLCGPISVDNHAMSIIVDEGNKLQIGGTIKTDISDDVITLEHTTGARVGRKITFTPSADTYAWHELTEFVRATDQVRSAGFKIE